MMFVGFRCSGQLEIVINILERESLIVTNFQFLFSKKFYEMKQINNNRNYIEFLIPHFVVSIYYLKQQNELVVSLIHNHRQNPLLDALYLKRTNKKFYKNEILFKRTNSNWHKVHSISQCRLYCIVGCDLTITFSTLK